MAKNVKDVTESLRLTKIIVKGWSLGVIVAQTVTTQYPDLVSRVVLIRTAPLNKNNDVLEKVFLEKEHDCLTGRVSYG
jgi:pimeloyl-ACP methyl ester carboxylesterase